MSTNSKILRMYSTDLMPELSLSFHTQADSPSSYEAAHFCCVCSEKLTERFAEVQKLHMI